MRADPRQKLGTPPVRNPITGEEKVEREKILDFARRHGWTINETHRDYYVREVWLSKNGERQARLCLFPGRNQNIATALIQRIQVHVPHGQMRTRVERFLAGVECICTFDPSLFSYEQMRNPNCPIHREEG